MVKPAPRRVYKTLPDQLSIVRNGEMHQLWRRRGGKYRLLSEHESAEEARTAFRKVKDKDLARRRPSTLEPIL